MRKLCKREAKPGVVIHVCNLRDEKKEAGMSLV